MFRVARSVALATGLLFAVTACVACGDDGDDAADAGTLKLVVSPEFVQGIIPDTPITVLVTAEGAGAKEIAISAEYSGGSVAVEPSEIKPGEVAEVTITARADATVTELTVRASRDGEEQSATRSIEVFPWEDDRETQAREILALFAHWLEENVQRLEIGPEREFEGVFVAPQLLVVSHYEFFDDEYELGLSWHIMLAPDDWAELYLRPRNQLRPVRAFRLSSWSTALAGGEVEFTEVAAPAEVVR